LKSFKSGALVLTFQISINQHRVAKYENDQEWKLVSMTTRMRCPQNGQELLQDLISSVR
jgi:hypothetical protein